MHKKLLALFTILFLISANIYSQTTIISDPLQGSTKGSKKGGSYTSEGYKPGTGENHILYKVPQQVENGYVEVEVKGFNFSDFQKYYPNESVQTSFFVMYDGRGVDEPMVYNPDYRNNFFRWEVVYRSVKPGSDSGNRFKGKMHTAAETSKRLNATEAWWETVSSGTASDWSIEPNGMRATWDASRWYTIRAQWDNSNKDFKIFRDGVEVWHNKKDKGLPYSGDHEFSSTSPYPWLPVDFTIWLGSGPRDYSSKLPNLVYRNFKVVQTSGSYTPPPAESSITVLSPNGGESLTVGDSYNIRWSSSSVSNVKIEYSINDGDTWSAIVNSTQSDGSHSWVVPDKETTEALVRVTSTSDSKITDVSNSDFEITDEIVTPPPSGDELAITAPSSGETLVGNSSHTIQWSGPTSIKNVRLYFSRDNGSSWSTIVGSTPNSGSYTWVVPNVNASNCIIRIKDTNNGNNYDRSDVFKIGSSDETPPPPSGDELEITSPSSGQILTGNTLQKIMWVAPSTIENVRLYFSSNKGQSWSIIVGSTSNNGSFDWVVPNINATECIIRIKDLSNSKNYDRSDIFKIGEGSETPPSGGIAITSPSSGQTLSSNTVHQINWNVASGIESVRIYFSKDNGNSWNTIVGSTPNDGSFDWIVPNSSSSSCIIRIKELSKNTSVRSSTFKISSSTALTKSGGIEAEESKIEVPTEYAIMQNYPNPFNPTTTIQFALPTAGHTDLIIYNSIGQEVQRLVSEYKSEGVYSVDFNASKLSSGVYFYTIRSGKFMETNKMLLLE